MTSVRYWNGHQAVSIDTNEYDCNYNGNFKYDKDVNIILSPALWPLWQDNNMKMGEIYILWEIINSTIDVSKSNS